LAVGQVDGPRYDVDMTPSRRFILIGLSTVFLLFPLVGCATQTDKRPGTPIQNRTADYFTLTLRMVDKTGKATYFEVDRSGYLKFGGGRDAKLSQANDVGFLTDEQLHAVLETVSKYNLVKTRNLFIKSSDRTEWLITFKGPQGSVNARSIDNEQPGLKELHDQLYEYQSLVTHDVPYLRQLDAIPSKAP
jgi:hypothetical protein